MKKTMLFVLSVLLLGSMSCMLIALSRETPTTAPTTGMLDLTIQYTGHWYRETFDYRPDSPDVRHMALILPSDFNYEKGAGWVFTSLLFTPYPVPFEFGEDSAFYEPMLEYLHDLPQGHAQIELTPGTYRMAIAFILAALPPPDDDSLLYPGVTGGGVSNDFQEIVIEAGETLVITAELTDENGWGCVNELAYR